MSPCAYATHIVKVAAERAVRLDEAVQSPQTGLVARRHNWLHVGETVFAAHRIRIGCIRVVVGAGRVHRQTLVVVAELIDVAGEQAGGQLGGRIVH